MQNKIAEFIRKNDLFSPGDLVICAVSGGADSVALLFALLLLKDCWDFTLEAAHFNHHLRGEESDRDEEYVRQLCQRLDIPLHTGHGQVTAGKKGLEAAAREARYAYFQTLEGIIATAHTADDNAETVMMHLIRGTGLKGLGGIAPKNGRVIRPMLLQTRADVETFLEEYCLRHIEDSSNQEDVFLRNRIRHSIMPLMKQENPKIARKLSAMALRLRQDEEVLAAMIAGEIPGVAELRKLPPALCSRYLERFLRENGVPEPEENHIALVRALLDADSPSACADFPGGVVIARRYDAIVRLEKPPVIEEVILECPGTVTIPELELTIRCSREEESISGSEGFTIAPVGTMRVRCRNSGDTMRLNGGTKRLKRLFIDRKIPAAMRQAIPVIADDLGVLGVWGIGGNLDRLADKGGVTVRFEWNHQNGSGRNDSIFHKSKAEE